MGFFDRLEPVAYKTLKLTHNVLKNKTKKEWNFKSFKITVAFSATVVLRLRLLL